jgi:hypothetical protein
VISCALNAGEKNWQKKAAPESHPFFAQMVLLKLNRGSTAEEVEQDGNYGQHQQNMNESAGYVERGKTQQPQDQENGGNDR